MRRTLLTRVGRIEGNAPERCRACGGLMGPERRWPSLLFHFEGRYCRGDGTGVAEADLVPCGGCGRSRVSADKIIEGIDPRTVF